MTTKTVDIDDHVALLEQVELCDYYRNRNLVLGQALAQTRAVAANLKKQVEEQAAEIERLRAPADPASPKTEE